MAQHRAHHQLCEDIAQEFIDFVNRQSQAYMDAVGGFAGHKARVERQVARAQRPVKRESRDGLETVTWASYEVEDKPDVILHRIIRTTEYLADNSPGGSNEQQMVRAILVFMYAYWDEDIRHRWAAAKKMDATDIKIDIFGDLRLFRQALLHKKGVMPEEIFKKLKVLGYMVESGKAMHIDYEHMHDIFVKVKQAVGEMLLTDLDALESAPFKIEELRDFAVQRGQRE
ncbi:MAG: hypothetical protein V4706_05480 [Pseudomonadota bacterium]